MKTITQLWLHDDFNAISLEMKLLRWEKSEMIKFAYHHNSAAYPITKPENDKKARKICI